MVKAELILKKAEIFEKLSLYGDKKSFLKAMGQAAFEVKNFKDTKYDAAIRQLNQAAAVLGRDAFFTKNTDISQAINELKSIRSELNAKMGTMDPDELARAREYYYNALNGIREYVKLIKSYRNQQPVTNELEPTYDVMKKRNPDLFTIPTEENKTPISNSQSLLLSFYTSQLLTAVKKGNFTLATKYLGPTEKIVNEQVSMDRPTINNNDIQKAFSAIKKARALIYGTESADLTDEGNVGRGISDIVDAELNPNT